MSVIYDYFKAAILSHPSLLKPMQGHGSITTSLAPESDWAPVDPRKLVVGGRYLREGDELQSSHGALMVVRRVDANRLALEITKPAPETDDHGSLERAGILTLTPCDLGHPLMAQSLLRRGHAVPNAAPARSFVLEREFIDTYCDDDDEDAE